MSTNKTKRPFKKERNVQTTLSCIHTLAFGNVLKTKKAENNNSDEKRKHAT